MLTALEQAQIQLAEVSKNHCRIKTTIEHWETKLKEAEEQIAILQPDLTISDRFMRDATQRVMMIEESLEKAQGEEQ